jgi:hypothetical protein
MNQLKIFLVFGLVPFLYSCGQQTKSSGKENEVDNQPLTMQVENISATEDQKERRAKSEKICKSRDIPTYKNPDALFIEPEEKVFIRTKDEVVDRVLALCYLGLKSEGLEQEHLEKMYKDYSISSKLTPDEQAFAFASNPTQQQKVNASWRYESMHVLLWSLGFIDSLDYPDHMCNVAEDVKIIYGTGEQEFRERAKLRSKQEILDQADLILRFDWACVSARVKNENSPGGLNSSVVYERHYSFNWLIKYLDQDWDNVTTDT